MFLHDITTTKWIPNTKTNITTLSQAAAVPPKSPGWHKRNRTVLSRLLSFPRVKRRPVASIWGNAGCNWDARAAISNSRGIPPSLRQRQELELDLSKIPISARRGRRESSCHPYYHACDCASCRPGLHRYSKGLYFRLPEPVFGGQATIATKLWALSGHIRLFTQIQFS